MKILISESNRDPLYKQIADQVELSIISAELKSGDALPSIRFLAKELSVSVITTKKSFEVLEGRGLIYSQPGRGYFVSKNSKEDLESIPVDKFRTEVVKLIDNALSSGLDKTQIKEIIKQELKIECN